MWESNSHYGLQWHVSKSMNAKPVVSKLMEPGAWIEQASWDYESHACIRLGYTVARKVPSGITVLLTRLILWWRTTGISCDSSLSTGCWSCNLEPYSFPKSRSRFRSGPPQLIEWSLSGNSLRSTRTDLNRLRLITIQLPDQTGTCTLKITLKLNP